MAGRKPLAWRHSRYGMRYVSRVRPRRARDRTRSMEYQLGASSTLGWTLLLFGLLLLVWRLRVDLSVAHSQATPSQPAPTGQGQPRSITPTPAPTATRSVAASVALPIAGPPSLTSRLVDGILAAYGSPLHGHGADLVALSGQYHIDDAVALAFFVMESRAGTQGEAVLTRSFGNLRPMPNAQIRDGYRSYSSWMVSTAEWFTVLRSFYLDHLKLATVEAVVPVYAPGWDSNDPVNMIAGIRQLVTCWRGVVAQCPDDPPGVRALVLADGAVRRAGPFLPAPTLFTVSHDPQSLPRHF